ncbi:hypothetical protein F4778DRAFT_782938 [Xylariomycetidae sp. FL2044]|nr:hypothetical protein F4778DRAFT_782938 [Xylariomycetidae sp. FL2044]
MFGRKTGTSASKSNTDPTNQMSTSKTTPVSKLDKSRDNCLYITLQYLRTVNKELKFHWGLYNTTSAPRGFLIHATDANRGPLDLYQEIREVSNPRRSISLVVCLKIADSPGIDALEYCASQVRLMDPRFIPRGERQWTCRVWVKEILLVLHNNGYLRLPAGLERCCLRAGNHLIEYMGNARVFNDLSWMSLPPTVAPNPLTRTTPMEVDSTGGGGRYTGPKPMDIDSTGGGGGRYFGPKPMVIDSTGGGGSYHGQKPMVIGSTGGGDRYYGSKPMVIDSTSITSHSSTPSYRKSHRR